MQLCRDNRISGKFDNSCLVRPEVDIAIDQLGVAVTPTSAANGTARFETHRQVFLRAAMNHAQPRANHGNVSNFGFTTWKSQCVTNRLTAYANSITSPPVIQCPSPAMKMVASFNGSTTARGTAKIKRAG
jgi:hypothetical protein